MYRALWDRRHEWGHEEQSVHRRIRVAPEFDSGPFIDSWKTGNRCVNCEDNFATNPRLNI